MKTLKKVIKVYGIVAMTLLALTSIQRASAQNAQGTIVGHVTDSTSAILPGAQITLRNQNTGVTGNYTTNSSGDYVFVNLNPGTYQVSVTSSGFESASASNLILEVEQTLRQNFSLKVGSATQEVTVTSDAQMLQTDNETTGQVIQGDLIEKLPLNGRDFTNLLQIGVGTTITPGGSQNSGFALHGLNDNFEEVSIDGARADSISYNIDGVYDSDFFFSAPTNIPGELAVQEFKTQNGMYGAEYGSGSAQVNVAIKSGANQYHGAAYEFLQNDFFQPDNASVIAENALPGAVQQATHLPFKQNQFGGTLGGPLSIPHLYDAKNKTFWFFSYDGGRRHQSVPQPGLVVATASQRAGNFSDWPYPIYDPLTTGTAPATTNNPTGRTPFPGNQIPGNRLDPVALKMVAFFNNGNVPGCTDLTSGCNNYIGNVLNTVNTNIETLRIDQNVKDRDHIFGTGNIGNENTNNPSLKFGQGNKAFARSRLFGLTWEHTVSSKTINQATLGYSREHFFTGGTTGFGPDYSANVGFGNTTDNPSIFGLPQTCFQSQYSCIGGSGNPTNFTDNIYQGVDTVTLIRGRHTLNFGIDFRRINLEEMDNFNGVGVLNFNGEFTASNPAVAATGFTAGNGPYEGNAFADFLLGQTSSASGPPPIGTDDYGLWGNNWNVFFQDDFRASEYLTINAGLRWERSPSFHSVDSSGYAFDPSNGGSLKWASRAFVTPILAAGGNPNYLNCCASNQLVNIDNKNFAPRIGFAFRPPATDKLVIRAGYGIFYDTYNRYYDGTQFDQNNLYTQFAAPYTSPSGSETQSTAVLKNLWSVPLTSIQGFSVPAYQFSAGQNGNQVNWPYNHTPYNQQWSLDTEYAVTPTLLFDAGYVGAHGVHEATQIYINAAFAPKVAGDICNSLQDASQADSSNNCASDPNFQPIDTRVPYLNLPNSLYANANFFNSSYNALQVQLIQRPIHGLQYHLNYTYSKTLDESSGINNISGEMGIIQNPHDIGSQYGAAASDQTHRVVATYAYDLPAGHGHALDVKNLNWLIGGWTTSGIYQIATGFPFSIGGSVSADQMGPNAGVYLANRTTTNTSGFQRTLTRYFDTTQYSTPQIGTYGNSGKSPERTPYFTNFDASFGKTTHFTDRQSLLFRAEIFNVASTWHSNTSLLFPDSGVGDSNFGSLLTHVSPQIGNANLFNPRIIQIGAQYSF